MGSYVSAFMPNSDESLEDQYFKEIEHICAFLQSTCGADSMSIQGVQTLCNDFKGYHDAKFSYDSAPTILGYNRIFSLWQSLRPTFLYFLGLHFHKLQDTFILQHAVKFCQLQEDMITLLRNAHYVALDKHDDSTGDSKATGSSTKKNLLADGIIGTRIMACKRTA